MRWQSVVLFVLCLLSGCGFHLRGELPLAAPLHNMYLQIADPYGPVAHSLKQYLKLSHVHLAETPATADTTLDVLDIATGQEQLSVNGNQQTRQYNLSLTVTYQVSDAKGTILMGPRSVTEKRVITTQSNQILAGGNEASSLYKLMYNAIAYDILNQLSSLHIAEQPKTKKQ